MLKVDDGRRTTDNGPQTIDNIPHTTDNEQWMKINLFSMWNFIGNH